MLKRTRRSSRSSVRRPPQLSRRVGASTADGVAQVRVRVKGKNVTWSDGEYAHVGLQTQYLKLKSLRHQRPFRSTAYGPHAIAATAASMACIADAAMA